MNLFDQNSIAIVGNAQSLFGKNLGSVIDSYDVVCRFNAGAHIIDAKQQGSKTDIVFVNGLKPQLPKFKTTTIHTSLRHRINGKSPCCDYEIPIKDNLELIELYEHNRPSSGLMALHYISKFSPSKVGIFGFDFKETKTFYHDSDKDNLKYQPHNKNKEKEYINKVFLEIENWKLY